jgi:hypothetical protein
MRAQEGATSPGASADLSQGLSKAAPWPHPQVSLVSAVEQ